MAQGDEGWGPSVTLEGEPIYAAFSRSTESGWSVAVGIPRSQIDEAVSQSLATVAFGLFVSLVVGALVSLSTARWVTGPIRELRTAAQAVGRGAVPDLGPTRVAEVNDVARALVGAARARRKAERELEETLARERDARTLAERANRSKDEFLAMLGHELRNPMSAIGNAIAVIEAQPRAPDPSASEVKARRVIRRQVDHLARLVDDLLDVARVVSGKVTLEQRSVDLAECVRHSLASLGAGGYLDSHEVNVDTETVWVCADPTRFEQVINNLVVNAVKYTPKGGHISVVTREQEGRAILRVTDDGVGIAAELLPDVFGLFTQGERALDRAQGGLGIGLTLVRRIVELHDGVVSATSAGENQGSVFTVELPSIGAPESEPVDTPAVRSARRHVLLVEDNRDAREMLQALLELHGHRVDVANDGPSGVSRALSSPPEVAFIDLGLPGFDGYEVARRLRAELPAERLMLVALSGYGSLEDRQRSQQAGFDHHLVKPVANDALEKIIARVAPG
jgi:signal transduction histidine kinase